MSRLRKRALLFAFNRYIRRELEAIKRFPILLEYPLQPLPRYGEGKPPHPAISAYLARDQDAYRATLTSLSAFSGPLGKVSDKGDKARPGEPFWNNPFFTSLDAITLYSLLGVRKPRRYIEVGSGHSTKFARRAVRDLSLSTEITSLDPAPRSSVDALCDRVIRQPLENADLSLFDELDAGDFLFIDNSHRVFQNSDATVFFLDVLPRLKPGVVVHVHDIFWPFDYPSIWRARYYSEQYVLAAFLLAGFSRMKVLLPLAYVSSDPSLADLTNSLWREDVFQESFRYFRTLTGGYTGVSFWFEMT